MTAEATGGRRCRRAAAGRGGALACRSDSDGGSTLILALIFLLVIGIMLLSLASLTAADLRLTSAFGTAQSMTAAADGVAAVALNTARTNFDGATLDAPVSAACSPAGTAPIDGVSMGAWCATLWEPLSQETRVVTISVCPSTESAVSCVTAPFLQVIATMDDYPSANSNSVCIPGTTQQTPHSTCGAQMTVDSWAYAVSPPSFSSTSTVSPAQPATCDQAAFTLSGANFVTGSQVYLASASDPSVIIPATGVVVTSATALSGTAGSIPAGVGRLYFEVVGATGPSAFGASTAAPSWTC